MPQADQPIAILWLQRARHDQGRRHALDQGRLAAVGRLCQHVGDPTGQALGPAVAVQGAHADQPLVGIKNVDRRRGDVRYPGKAFRNLRIWVRHDAVRPGGCRFLSGSGGHVAGDQGDDLRRVAAEGVRSESCLGEGCQIRRAREHHDHGTAGDGGIEFERLAVRIAAGE